MRTGHFDTLFAKEDVSVSMADPSQPNCPLIDVNDAFSALTGYKREEVLGKNCRFLQGAETSPESRNAISKGLSNNDTICVCIKNYRKDGTPFDNLLFLSPVRDDVGRPRILGCQTTIREDQWIDDIERNIFNVGSFLERSTAIEIRSLAQRFVLQSKTVIAQARSYYLIKGSARLIENTSRRRSP